MKTRAIFSLALTLASAGCAMEVEGEQEPGLDEAEIIAHNRLETEQIVLNSLTGTGTAIDALIGNPLATATFDKDSGAIPHAFLDPNARVFGKYLMECALTPTDVVSYTTFTGKTFTFKGKYGLCPEWADGPAPDAACTQIVTACLLARNNMMGDEVNISMLGMQRSGSPLPLAPRVAVKATTLSSTPIASFGTCKVAQSGAARDCGFSAAASLVGTCTPGEEVKLDCKAGSAPIAVRVVEGIEGANHGSPLILSEATVCTAQAPSLSFVCGEDFAFSLMIGPAGSAEKLAGSFSGVAGAVYPAPEQLVHPYEEGSFYGDLFVASAHSSTVVREVSSTGVLTTFFPPLDQTVFGAAFACNDPNWSDAAGYMTHRRCATVSDDGIEAELCAAEHAGVCVGGPAPRCSIGDALPSDDDGDNDNCLGPVAPVVHQWPLTTRLHNPCDLVPPGKESICDRRDVP
jgi:hypothetical protein